MNKSLFKTKGEKLFDITNILFMVFLGFITLYPFYYVLMASFSDAYNLIRHTGILLMPLGFQTETYRLVFRIPILLSSYMNTFIYVTVGTFISISLTIMGAYALSRKIVLRKQLMIFIVFTMWFSGGLIPLFLQVRNLGLIDTRWSLILPNAVIAYNFIVMWSSFNTIPDSLEESARIDGAKDFTILMRIVVPLSIPVISVIALFYAVQIWNSWFHAMIFLRSRSLYPLQLVLREVLILNDPSMMAGEVSQGEQVMIGETIRYATIVVSTVPILCVYPFIQKYFVGGIMIGAIKG